jgi:hypothetical protein
MVRTFIWDGENIARQSDREYTHNPQAYGELISQGGEPGTYFHHGVYPERRRGNALASTDRLTDPNETTSVSYVYKAFGGDGAAVGGCGRAGNREALPQGHRVSGSVDVEGGAGRGRNSGRETGLNP